MNDMISLPPPAEFMGKARRYMDVDFSLPVPSGGRWVRVQSMDTREELNQQIDRAQAKQELAVRTFHCDKD
jgi:hypothetical protein